MTSGILSISTEVVDGTASPLKMATAPQRFTINAFQRTHQTCCRNLLVAVISVDVIFRVKHAADEQRPLLTAVEQAGRVIAAVFVGKFFTPEQQQWLDHTRASLIENRSIDREDSSVLSGFKGAGSRARQARSLRGLGELIRKINKAIAA